MYTFDEGETPMVLDCDECDLGQQKRGAMWDAAFLFLKKAFKNWAWIMNRWWF